MKQTYRITVVFDADVNQGDPKDWLREALDKGDFKHRTTRIFSTSVEPIDKESPENNWIKDLG